MPGQQVEFVISDIEPPEVLQVPVRLVKSDKINRGYIHFECYASGKWHRLAWLTHDGELGLSNEAQNIPGIKTNESGTVKTF